MIERVTESFIPSWILKAILAGALILLVSTAWAFTLRRRLAAKETLLRQEFEQKSALEARFSDLAQNASDLLMTWDESGHITSGNVALERTLGYSLNELLQMRIQDLIVPEHGLDSIGSPAIQNRQGAASHMRFKCSPKMRTRFGLR